MITIPVSAVLALSAIPMAQAATITVDFSKAPNDGSQTIKNGSVELNGFTFVGNNSKVTLGKGGFYTGGGSSETARHIYFTPSKNGTLTVAGNASADNTDRYIFVATAAGGSSDASTVIGKVDIPTKGVKNTLTVSGLIAGTTYYICLQGNGTITSISYVEDAGPTKDVEVTVNKDKTEGTGSIVLNKGTYTLSAANGDLTAKIGNAVVANNDAVVITENNTTVDLSVKLDAKATADTKVAVTAEISDLSLNPVKNVYVQKVSIMINKAGSYTDDATLQALADDASKLMASVNKMGLAQYDEYVTTGAIKTFEDQIADLTAKINKAEANYNGYVYAQEQYGNKFVDGEWVSDTTPGEGETLIYKGLLAKKARLDATYNDLPEEVKTAAQPLYDETSELFTNYLDGVKKAYADATVTDLKKYKADIDAQVTNINESIATAIESMTTGGDNVLAYALVNSRIATATNVYEYQATALYNLLTGHEGDGKIYNDIYVAALQELNSYLRIINDAKAANEAAKTAGTCATVKDELMGAEKLGKIVDEDAETDNEEIYGVLERYTAKAKLLRGNYARACEAINNLASSLKTDVNDKVADEKYADVLTYYSGAVSEIEDAIEALQANVDAANVAHTIGAGTEEEPFCDGYAKDKQDITDAISALQPKVDNAVAEYQAYLDAKDDIKGVEDTFKACKNEVETSKDKAYNQTEKFNKYESRISELIQALYSAASGSLKSETGYDGRTAREFLNDIADNVEKEGKVVLYGLDAVSDSISNYAATAATALSNYAAVADKLAEYDLYLNTGRAADAEKDITEIVALVPTIDAAEKADGVGYDVTIDGQLTTGSKTYRDSIAVIKTQIAALQKALDDAEALTDTAHVEALAAVNALLANADEPYSDLTTDIQTLTSNFADKKTEWVSNNTTAAAARMLAVANNRNNAVTATLEGVVTNYTYTDDYNTEGEVNSNKSEFQKDTYGKAYSELNKALKECTDLQATITLKITEATGAQPANAIAILSTIQGTLDDIETKSTALATNATAKYNAYKKEKEAAKELKLALKKVEDEELVKVSSKDEIVKGLKRKIGDVVINFSDEYNALSDSINGTIARPAMSALEAINDSLSKENVVIGKAGLQAHINRVKGYIANVVTLIGNEKANDDAKGLYDAKLTELKIDDALEAINFCELGATDPAYIYFNSEKTRLATKYGLIKTEADNAYAATAKALAADGNTPLAGAINPDNGEKYTDTAKNLAAKWQDIQTRLTETKDTIAGLSKRIADNIEAKARLNKTSAALKAKSDSIFKVIAGLETSSAHKAALATVLEINDSINSVNKTISADYGNGLSAVNETEVEARLTAISNQLVTLCDGWEDVYLAAVTADNLKRKEKFDAAYTSLANTYSKEVATIEKLSKLSYNDAEKLQEVVGADGIYSYASKIRTLKSETDALFEATKAPALFDAEEAQAKKAADMQDEIVEKSRKYTDAVNTTALATYTAAVKLITNAEQTGSLDEAKKAVQDTLGIADANFEAVQDILDDAATYAAYETEDETLKFKYEDFAYYLDNTILKNFATVDAEILKEKNRLAVQTYTEMSDSLTSIYNAEKIVFGSAGFDRPYIDEAGNTVTDEEENVLTFGDMYAKFYEETLDSAATAWGKIADDKKFAMYSNASPKEDEDMGVKELLAAFADKLNALGTDRKTTLDDGQEFTLKGQSTELFWKAKVAKANHDANDTAYNSLKETRDDVQKVLDDAKDFVAALIVKNEDFGFATQQLAIDNQSTAIETAHDATGDNSAAGKKAAIETTLANIVTEINGTEEHDYGIIPSVLRSESTALAMQIAQLQQDYNLAEAEVIHSEEGLAEYQKTIAEYTAENTRILTEYTTGVQNEETLVYVKATAEDTRVAFLALEANIAKTKAELVAIYNADSIAGAQAVVQAEIDALLATYNDLTEQLESTYAEDVVDCQEAVDEFKAGIDALQAALDKEVADKSILLYKDVNVASAEALAESISGNEGLKATIASAQAKYKANEEAYERLSEELQGYKDKASEVYEAADGYEHKAKYTSTSEEWAHCEYWYQYQYERYCKPNIERSENSLQEKYEAHTLDAETGLPYKSSISNSIDILENSAAKYNANMSIQAAELAQTAVADVIAAPGIDSGFTPAAYETLKATSDSLYTAIANTKAYHTDAQDGFVRCDIDGNVLAEEEDSKAVVYMEVYAEVMDKLAELSAKIEALDTDVAAEKWQLGDVDHSGKVTVNDYNIVRQMVLELVPYTEADAIFYAADVNQDRVVNIGDVTKIAKHLMYDTPFVAENAASAFAKAMSRGVENNGSLVLTAEGSGLTQTVKVALDTQMEFVGGQFDVVLPTGVKLVSVASSSHDALMGAVSGATRVLVSNLENTEIIAGQPTVELNVEVDADYDGGEIKVSNAQFADADGTVFRFDDASVANPTGLTTLTVTEKVKSKVYNVGGQLMNKVRKGINIIVNSDGTTKKQAIE